MEGQADLPSPSSIFVLAIENFSKLGTKFYSDVFVHGDYKWRVLIFPKGNKVDHLSLYLDVADSPKLPQGWSRHSMFGISVVNRVQTHSTVRKDTRHMFHEGESDWGFTSFMPLDDLYDVERGFLVNDTLTIEIEFPLHYVSKLETGHVGLKNHGATSCMTSLLQTLYHIPYFRKAVYHMPIVEGDTSSRSIPSALQSLFYDLRYSYNSVATKELTKFFGCDTYDVHELNMVLCENLEEKMKGTVLESTIQKLFEGHQLNCITCVGVNYNSKRTESFYDLQLDVKGCPDVYASFDKYVSVEQLEGDNRYRTEEHGLQDARKGALFADFPPVLQLQLKRFEYDSVRDTMVKINDRYEFPLELDLDRENGKYLSPDADRGVRNLFTLHSVLVHSGGEHGGRYHVFIRPTLSDQWLKFDDQQVTKEDTKRALEDQYGGEEELPQTDLGFTGTALKLAKESNAYMLVYIRKSDIDKVMCNVNEEDITEQLRVRLRKEQEEKEQKKKEAKLYTTIKVARKEDLVEQIGRDVYFDLVDHDKVRCFRVLKQRPFYSLKEEIANAFGIPVQFQRFWLWAKRQNQTYRPERSLTPEEEVQPVGQIREVSNKAHNAELKLFLDVEIGPDRHPIKPPERTNDDIIIFLKLYDPSKEELRYIGRLFVKRDASPSEILLKLNEMAGFSPTENLTLYEEIKFEPIVMCIPIEKELTFEASELGNGDIICIQKSPEVGSEYSYPDVPSFLDFVHNRQVTHFRSLEKPKDEDFCLELSKLYNYDEVVEKVAFQVGVCNPSYIRLTSHNGYTQKPKPTPIKYRGPDHLSDMLVHRNQTSNILYYEILEANVYTIVKVARNEDLAQQIGKDVCFELVNHDKVRSFRIKKQMPFFSFKEEVAKEFGIPEQFQRFWLWAKRQNHTYRPHRPLTHEETTQPVGQLREISDRSQNAELNLFLEVELGPDLHPIHPPEICREDILLFFKLYDPIKEEIRYVGKLLVKTTDFPATILTKLNEMAGFYASQELDLYEEIKFEPSVMCEPIAKELTFQASQLENGDIVCFQKSQSRGRQQYRYPNVPSYLEYVHNRQIVCFRSLKKPKQVQFSLELTKLSNYDDIVRKVASKLSIYDPSSIRLTPHDTSSNKPKSTPIKYRDLRHLSDLLNDGDQATDILYYEVLEISGSHLSGPPSSCVICLDAPKEGACIPCGHMSGCMSCLNVIKEKNMGCPVCRAEIQQVIRIYTV